MEKTSGRIGLRLSSFGCGADGCIAAHVIGWVLPLRKHWHKKRAVSISYDVHESDPQGPCAHQLVCGCSYHHRLAGSPAPSIWSSTARGPGTSRPLRDSRISLDQSFGWVCRLQTGPRAILGSVAIGHRALASRVAV